MSARILIPKTSGCSEYCVHWAIPYRQMFAQNTVFLGPFLRKVSSQSTVIFPNRSRIGKFNDYILQCKAILLHSRSHKLLYSVSFFIYIQLSHEMFQMHVSWNVRRACFYEHGKFMEMINDAVLKLGNIFGWGRSYIAQALFYKRVNKYIIMFYRLITAQTLYE